MADAAVKHGDDPLRRDGGLRGDRRRSRNGGDDHRRDPVPGRRRRSTPTCPSPTGTCSDSTVHAWNAWDYSPSCWLMLAGSSASPKIAHHNIHFARVAAFVDEVLSGNPCPDPSFLVTNPSHSDPSLVPAGKQSYHALFITPNTRGNVCPG